jgi:hypothetical protein
MAKKYQAKTMFNQEESKQAIDIKSFEQKANEIIENVGKEEPKQQTIEQAAADYAHNWFNMHDTNNYKALRDGFIAGAEEQAKTMYSEEEVLKSADYLGFKQITLEELNSLPYQPFITDEDGNIWVIDKKEWFEQFKKQ